MLRKIINKTATRRIASNINMCRYFSVQELAPNGEVLLEHTSNGHFATVTINRPEVHNALSPGVMDGLETALNTLKEDEKVHAVF